jgi:hypothetical protein
MVMMHNHASFPRCISMLPVCPCWMSIMHIHVYAACPRIMPLLNLHASC